MTAPPHPNDRFELVAPGAREPVAWDETNLGAMPLVVGIRRGSQHDGPGLRSVVFFKGCHLRCSFCQNPETQSKEHELAYRHLRCIKCGTCATTCPHGAIMLTDPTRIERHRCQRCGACAAACPAGALQMLGTAYNPAHLSEILLRDVEYYRHSGGGVTLSGGECLLFPAYLCALLGELEGSGVRVAIQTGGEFKFESAIPVLERVTLIQYDLKFAEPSLYEAHTGRRNVHVFENLRRLLALHAGKVEVRVPLIPDVTTTDENLHGLAQLLRQLAVPKVTLLPFNPLGGESLVMLGRGGATLPKRSLTPQQHAEILTRFRAALTQTYRR